MIFEEDDCLPLSGIQNIAFCPRQFALIYVERVWADNVLTFEGREMHQRAHDPFYFEARGTTLVSRGVPLLARSLGLYGVADVVEFHACSEGGVTLEGRGGQWRPFPVEYKSGRAKPDERDIVQVCAQAICLEEMLGVEVPKGALFYGKPRKRQSVDFNRQIRDRVVTLAAKMHEIYSSGHMPPPTRTRACNSCSLKDMCLPKVTGGNNAGKYMQSVKTALLREGGES